MKIKNTAVDSLKLKILYRKISFKDKEAKERYTAIIQQINSKTSEILKDKKEKYELQIPELAEKGISVTLQVGAESTPNYTNKWNERKEKIQDYLYITINSKLLKNNYLQGITKKNILQCYNTIMKTQDDIYFSYNDFLNANCVDTDIKIDIHTQDTIEQTKNTLKELESITKNGDLKTSKKQQGLQFFYRQKEDKVISKPYLKFYNKNLELENKSKDFKNNFLSDNPELKKSILRLEGTIKNKKHWQSLYKSITGSKTDSFRLHQLLELNTKQLEQILSIMLSKYLKLESKQYTQLKGELEMININNLKPSERLLYIATHQNILAGMTIEEHLKILKLCQPKNTYYRQKEVIKSKIYPMLLNKPEIQKKINQNKIIEAILNLGK